MSKRDLMAAGADGTAQVLDSVRRGQDVVVTDDPAGRALLDRAAALLEGECRVLRVEAAAAGLSLSGLMAQVADHGDLAGQDDSVLELGYRRLAVPAEPGERIALLIDGAGRLQRAALRFLQHVARGAPALVLVVTGGPALDALLEDPDFAILRARLAGTAVVGAPVASLPATAAPIIAAAAIAAPVIADPPEPVRERVSTVSVRTRRVPLWALAGAGMAASAALAAWVATDRPDNPAPATIASAEVTPVVAQPPPATAPRPAQSPQAASAQEKAPAPAEPPRQEAMLVPQPVLAAPSLPVPPAEPTRPPAPKPAEMRRKEPAHPSQRQVRAARPAPHLPEFERASPSWEDERPRPVFSGPMPPYWGRSREVAPYDPPPSDEPYIGTYTRDSYGMRTFHYGR